MAFWIFKCNPEKYRLEQRLADPNPTLTWTVSRHRDKIEPGDIAFLWVTGRDRGIRAIMRVDEAPRLMAEFDSEQTYWVEQDTRELWRVSGAFIHRNIQISSKSLHKVPGLEELSVFHGWQQTTNFPVTPDEGAILTGIIETDLGPSSSATP